MKTKSLRLLRIGAVILGCLFAFGLLVSIGTSITLYHHSQNDPVGWFWEGHAAQFSILHALSTFFSHLGHAFFAFLIAAVVRMIEKHAAIGYNYARSLMIVCCLAFLAEALVQSCFFFIVLTGMSSLAPVSGSPIPRAASIDSFLSPVLYAASIYILFTHFTRLLIFESEVA